MYAYNFNKSNFIVYTQESKVPEWQLIPTAGSTDNSTKFLEIFVDVLPMSSSSTALAYATKVHSYNIAVLCSSWSMFIISDSRGVS